MLSLRNLGLPCQGYQVKTCRCRIIRTICLPQNCSVIETERLLVWVQLMLAPDNNSMLETFFTWRCHYLFHLCGPGLNVLSDNGIRVSKDWVAGDESYQDTHKMLEIEKCHFQRRNPPRVPRPHLLPGQHMRRHPWTALCQGRHGATCCSLRERLEIWEIWLLLRIFAVLPQQLRQAQTRARMIFSPLIHSHCAIPYSFWGTQLEWVRFGIQVHM